ncbi:response regulator [Wenzhouxiangella sp. XN201]|uniref:response regulator n=1 Tax=Wenzhouxiangella sp. XN201 TaxID=2710755 RepID=UPI0013C9C174|nr:response regulator [Wenzhouxiangella sp. XN201]
MNEHEQPASEGARILVVDDNEMNRDLLSRRLQKRGYRVSVVQDGRAALEWLEGNPCDLVLLDIMMPGISGIEVLNRLRETRDVSELPIIMATAKGDQSDIVDALKRGANDYVTKPLEFPVVLARVQTQLALKAANDQVRRLAEEVERRNAFIRSVFGRYLTDEVAETLLDSPEALSLGGERREMTIMLADLRSFSSFAAQHDPQEVMQIVNNFLSKMTEVIIAHGGTIDEFIGDAILALFGAPRPLENHASCAVACAVAMQQAMDEVNRLNADAGLPDVAIGIGINTGEVVVGNIGSEKRAKYGVVGHHVNMASRIEAYTTGGQILISERTRWDCGDLLRVKDDFRVRPKGFDHEITLYDVAGIDGAAVGSASAV